MLLFGQVIQLHVKLEGLLGDGLVLGVIVLLEVGVGQGILHLDV